MPTRHLLPALALIAVSLTLAACGDGDGPETIVITSDDGKLTIEIPPDALDDEDLVMSITTVPLEELPEELQVVRGAGTGYRLEPDGLEFNEPVAVSLELDRSELEDEPEDGISAYALVSFSDDGELELLDRLVTEATLGEETIVARGELSHFSWIVRTKGSLVVFLEEVPRTQPVGGSFTAVGRSGNGDLSDTVTLEKAGGTFLAFGTVSTLGNTTFGGNAKLRPDDAVEGTGTFQCGQSPGLGTYTVQGKATSVVVVDDERRETPLRVTVDGVVECVVATPTPGQPTPTATPEETAAQQVTVLQMAGCVHTQPGIQSEVQSRVFVFDLGRFTGGLPPLLENVTVDAGAKGPGLLQPTASGMTDAHGQALLIFPIDSFGPYQIMVDQLIGPDGNVLVVAPGSQLSVMLEVGDVCAPPGQLPTDDAVCGQDLGDVNGDGEVTLVDASLVLQYEAGLIDSLPCPDAADVNGDGTVDVEDAGLILQFVADVIDSLPP